MMQFSREINRLLVVLLAAFALVGAAAAYWSVVGSSTILNRSDNPRLVETERQIQRGSIFDRNGDVLVESTSEGGVLTRHYLYEDMYSTLGYFSARYGVSGAEAAYNTILRGDEQTQGWGTFLSANLLHRPQVGADIRLTFDRGIQQVLTEAMKGQSGAAIVLSIPSGEVLGMVSLPTYDPNTLDANWEMLVQAAGQPFFNRALQGNYQPGGTLQSLLMAAAILSGQAVDQPIENATRPVNVGEVEINCAAVLPPQELTLRQAYAFGCPYPFQKLGETLGFETVEAIFDTFRLDRPPVLPGYIAENPANPTPAPLIANGNNQQWIDNVLGQGSITITPLEMVMIVGAVVNDGNAPQPYTLLSVRQPGTIGWTEAEEVHPSIPMMTANTARQLQDLMRLAVANGAAQNSGRPNIDMGGHATLAYSGDVSQAWFIGFTTLGGRQGIAIAVVIENSADPGLAADIGGSVLEAAHIRFQNRG
jgi:penicillin-binding protein A